MYMILDRTIQVSCIENKREKRTGRQTNTRWIINEKINCPIGQPVETHIIFPHSKEMGSNPDLDLPIMGLDMSWLKSLLPKDLRWRSRSNYLLGLIAYA